MKQSHIHTRRSMLKGLAGTALAGIVTQSPIDAFAAATTRPSCKPIWPVGCRDKYSMHMPQPDFWAGFRKIGVECLEVRVDDEHNCPFLKTGDQAFTLADADGVARMKERFEQEGLRLSAFCLSNRVDSRPASEEVAFVMKVVDACVEMGVPAVRLDVVPHRLKGQEKAFLEVAIKFGKELIQASEGTGVRFGVENHGGTTNKVEVLKAMFGGIGSKRFGSTLDTGNFYWYGYPLEKLYEIYETFAPWACHTHCKSIAYPEDQRNKQRPVGWEYGKYCSPIYDGDIDFQRVARILDEANYTGDLCIENESLGKYPIEQRAGVIEREIELLKKVAAKVGRRTH